MSFPEAARRHALTAHVRHFQGSLFLFLTFVSNPRAFLLSYLLVERGEGLRLGPIEKEGVLEIRHVLVRFELRDTCWARKSEVARVSECVSLGGEVQDLSTCSPVFSFFLLERGKGVQERMSFCIILLFVPFTLTPALNVN